MAKKPKRKATEKTREPGGAWLSPRTGLTAVTLVSIALGLWVSWNAVQASGLAEGVFWGFVFGGSIWVIFLGTYLLNRWFRRR